MSETTYYKVIRDISDRLVNAQRPIRILDALKWNTEIEQDFFAHKFKKLPAVDAHFYEKNPLKFDPQKKIEEFDKIERDIRRELGQFSPVGLIMQRMSREYSTVVEMLKARGTPHFTRLSQQLYGSAEDAFYAGAPTLKDLAVLVSNTLGFIEKQALSQQDVKSYTSEEAVLILEERLKRYFTTISTTEEQTRVKLSDDIVADAAAGAEVIKLRRDATFSERDLRVFEVHEGWVHLATTLNGLAQPVCTFLSKGPPSSTITQEGLAIIMEIFTFSSHPHRMQRLTDRVTAISMAEQGAHFIEVFNFFREQGHSEEESYSKTSRVFRGSTPDGGPFTKDLVYNKGFILIYNYLRLAIQNGLLSRIPLLFLGKTTLEDLHVLNDLVEEGMVTPPKFIPPQFNDLAGLSAWMCYSLFLNRLDLKRLAIEYKSIL
jgi:uncharacterized protein (TIGR02421 family)